MYTRRLSTSSSYPLVARSVYPALTLTIPSFNPIILFTIMGCHAARPTDCVIGQGGGLAEGKALAQLVE